MFYEIYQNFLAEGYRRLRLDGDLQKVLGDAIYLQMPGDGVYDPIYLRLKPLGVKPKSTNTHEIWHARLALIVISRGLSLEPVYEIAHRAHRAFLGEAEPRDWPLDRGEVIHLNCEKTRENWQSNGRIFQIQMNYQAILSQNHSH